MRHRTPRAVALTLAAVLTTAAGGPAARGQQQQGADLRLRMTPGTKVAFERVTKFSVPANGTAGAYLNVEKRSGTVTCLSVQNGQPTAIRVEFAADCGQTTTKGDGGEPEAKPFVLAGKTVRVTRDPSGSVRVDAGGADPGGGTDAGGPPASGDLDPQVTVELTGMIYGDHALMPGRPVAVGDTWTPDPAVAVRESGLPDGSTVSAECKLTGLGNAAGRPVAEVSVTSDISLRTPDGASHKVTTTGTSVYDLATGVGLKADSSGTMDLGGGGGNALGQPAVQANLESHVVQRVTPAANRAPAADDGGGGILGRLAGGVGDDAASARFAGTFRSDRMTLTLAPAGGGGRLAGSIVRGANTFPAQARADGDRLTGTFTAAGTTYDFTATLDGPSLHLSSSGKDYDLEKAAPTRTAAPNPLDGN